MGRKNLIQGLAIAVALTIVATAGAHAQTKPKTSVAPAKSGAFDKLSLGNQKVAFALYQAQNFGVAATIANASTPVLKPLTLEQIAAKRRSGQEWGPIFREMKALGLVHEKSLGQVVAKYHQTFDAPSSAVASDN
jgi:hypothetical protein